MPLIEQAILSTVAYADIFDYPLTEDEIHWYLWGVSASREEVAYKLRAGSFCRAALSFIACGDDEACAGYYPLRGREATVELRRRRERVAAPLWRKACSYARMIARLPFVRMVALTGSLAVGNVERGSDIDYLIITEHGRLWLCRASVIGLGHWAATQGDIICPNYFLSENALVFGEQNLYTARELTQMIPLYGLDTYYQLLARNPWVHQYLPNAKGPPSLTRKVIGTGSSEYGIAERSGLVKKLAEAAFRTPAGARLEGWEMQRKLRKFSQQLEDHPESVFSPDCCKGHFNDHMTHTQLAFRCRLQDYGLQEVGIRVGSAELQRLELERATR